MNDLISRQAVLDKAFEIKTGEHTSAVVVYAHDISTSPSVKPLKINIGHWVDHWIPDFTNWWDCSECGQRVYSETRSNLLESHAFCGRCGCRMIDSLAESEEKCR